MNRFNIDVDIMLGILNDDDAVVLWRLIESNRNYLREWLPWLDTVLQPQDAVLQIIGMYEQYMAKNSFRFGIWFKGELCGMIGLENVNWLNRNSSIGYWLGEEHQGKGIITRSCAALFSFAFEELQLNRIEIRCAEQNYKSIAVPERLGLTREGVLREAEWLYDHYVNHIVYSILQKEWLTEEN